VRIDVDVCDAFEPGFLSQKLDSHTAVVKNAETRGTIPRGVMKARDRHKGAATLALHNRVGGIQSRAHDAGGRFVHASKCGRITPIEKPLPADGTLSHKVHIGGRVKSAQLFFRGNARLENADALIQSTRFELAYECRMAVGTEGMAVTEAVASKAVANDHCHAERRPVRFHVGASVMGEF